MRRQLARVFFAVITFIPPAYTQAQTEDTATVEEILVTATRRVESLQEVPVAVTALNAESLDRAGVKDLRDLDTLATSFSMNSSQTETGGTTLRIRGVGTTGNNIGLESAVGVFLDDVYLSRPGVALGDLMDVEQIEVLRGPQGTLFGRNTSAGAISIRTRRPNLSENESFANITAANYDGLNFQAGVSGPIVEEELGYRLSIARRKQSGFLESTTGAESRNRDRVSLRGQLLWNLSDTADLRFIADYAEADEQCCDAVVVQGSAARSLGSFAAAGLPADGGVKALGDSAVENMMSNAEQFENGFEQTGLSAELNWELNDAVALTWLTSWRDFDSDSVERSDFVDLDVFAAAPEYAAGFPNTIEIDTFTTELRLTGETDRLNWMLGAYLSDEQIHSTAALGLGGDFNANVDAMLWRFAFGPVLGAAPLLGRAPLATGGVFADVLAASSPTTAFAGGVDAAGSYAQNIYTQDGRSSSIFTHNILELSGSLDLIVGLRWIDEEKDGAYNQARATNQACANTVANAGALAAAAAGTGLEVVAGTIGNFSAGYVCFPFAAPADVLPGRPVTFADTYADDELAYTVKLSNDFSDIVSGYVSFTHGFKSGGFNLDSTAAIGGADPRFRGETNDAWEAGLKTQLFGDRLRANIAAWDYDLEDFQVLEFTGVQFKTFNVPKARSQGAELELEALLTDNLRLDFGYTLAQSEYPDDCDGNDPNAAASVSSLCGAALTNAPENVVTAGLDYQGYVGDYLYFLSGNYRWVDDRRTSTQPNLDFDIQQAHDRVNLRAGIGDADGGWTLELWGNNITDTRARNVTFNVPLRVGTRATFIEAPRTYGATLRMSF